jgi:hypothetical protein
MGYVAAVIEMLLQTHLPSTMVLAPALPIAWQLQGHIYGLRGRGDSDISFAWKRGKIEFVHIRWNSRHPWWTFGEEDAKYPGFFNSFADSQTINDTMQVHIVAPNRLTQMDLHETNASLIQDVKISHDLSRCSTCSFPPVLKTSMKVTTVTWEETGDNPPAMFLCAEEMSKNNCQKHYQEFIIRR